MNNFDDATHMFRKSILITKKISGGDHPVVARKMSHMSSLLALQTLYREAIAGYVTAINIFEQSLGHHSAETLTAKGELGMIMLSAGNEEEGLGMIEEAVAVLRFCGGYDDSATMLKLRKYLLEHSKTNNNSSSSSGSSVVVSNSKRFVYSCVCLLDDDNFS